MRTFSKLFDIYAYVKLVPWDGAIYDPRNYIRAKLNPLVLMMLYIT